MNKIRHKLRSRTGASMILALVFLLFCSFVGSTVLVSATANSYRVAHLADQQDYLSQRSLALVISDELQLLEESDRLQLNVIDTVKSTQTGTYVNGGGFESDGSDPTVERTVTFQVTTTLASFTPMQRLMLETAIWRYIQTNPTTDASISSTNYEITALGATLHTGELWYQWDNSSEEIQGEIAISGSTTDSDVTLPSCTAYFSSGRGDDLYDFRVDFGEYSQLKITMNAYSGTSAPIVQLHPPTNNGPTYIQVTTDTTQTVISWSDPIIEKGGAEE